MIDSNTILYVIYFAGAFTLYYTYQNDFNVFLLTLTLALGSLWCYLYINEYIDKFDNKIDNIENTIGSKIDFLLNKLFNVKDNVQQKMEQVSNM